MPLASPTYRAPLWLVGGHAQTIWPALMRRVPEVAMRRERISTADGDFLDLDWSTPAAQGPARGLVILSHGLEGSSRQPYVRGMAHAFLRRGWDVLAWNFRGCSGEPNWLLRSYHSGESSDLRAVLDHALRVRNPGCVALVGFSIGGNITLKLLGELGDAPPAQLVAAVVFSVPCDLASSAARLARWNNRLYMRRFLRTLVRAIRGKAVRYPGMLDVSGIDRMRTFAEFDERFTARLHGFASAQDYWARSSSRQFVPRIRVPTLIVNARNDPFLAPECFPEREAEQSAFVTLEMPAAGGHVGFAPRRRSAEYWSERRGIDFVAGICGRLVPSDPRI